MLFNLSFNAFTRFYRGWDQQKEKGIEKGIWKKKDEVVRVVRTWVTRMCGKHVTWD